MPRASARTMRGVLGLVTILFVLIFGIVEHDVFFFPMGIAYMAYGVLRAAFLGLLSEPDDDEEAEIAGPIMIADGPEDEDDEEEGVR